MTQTTDTNTDTKTSDILTPTDEELLDEFFDFLGTGRIAITTGYLKNEQGVLTHSAIIVRVGELEGSSAPQELTVPLLPIETTKEEAN